jgi:DNA phosphorothioation-dependent restriction protein DptG
MSIQENLDAVAGLSIKDRNFVNHYLTFRQQRSERVTDTDSAAVMGELLALVSKKSLKPKATLDKFITACRQRLQNKIADPDFEALLKEMYFDNDAQGLYKVSPEFLLFKTGTSNAGNTLHVARALGNMLLEVGLQSTMQSLRLNFLENEFRDEFQSLTQNYQPQIVTTSYLPFMAQVFSEDMVFLCQHPNYMMQNMRAFIGLYNFLYSSQLALNIHNWKTEPDSKPLFFILDTEQASAERTHVRDALPSLTNRVLDLFPILSALEYLNQADSKTAHRYPLWMHYQYISSLTTDEQAKLLEKLAEFVRKFRDKRKQPLWNLPIDSAESAINAICETAQKIFSQPRSNQLTVNRKVLNAFENEIAGHFIQNRKRGGRVLIMNQDYLLLLTNLVVGENNKILFQQLLTGFQNRGVWFDQQSELALIEFYERVGNLERMSDSGDAVYVRKTI